MANKKFTQVKHDFCINLDAKASIQPCGDENDIMTQAFSFTKLSDVSKVKGKLDVLGIVTKVEDSRSVIVRGNDTLVRNIALLDNSQEQGVEIECSLWGNLASFDLSEDMPVAMKAVSVNDRNGIALAASYGADIITELSSIKKEVEALKQWYQRYKGQDQKAIKITNKQGNGEITKPALMVTIGEMMQIVDGEEFKRLAENESMFFKTYFKFQRIYRTQQAYYKSCPSEKCNKKVMDDLDGKYTCESCSKKYDTCELTYTASCQISDHQDQCSVQFFRDNAEKVLGLKPEEYKVLTDTHEDDQSVNREVQHRMNKFFSGTIKAQMKVYNGSEKCNLSCIKVEEAKPADHARFLLGRLSTYAKSHKAVEEQHLGSPVGSTSASKQQFDY